MSCTSGYFRTNWVCSLATTARQSGHRADEIDKRCHDRLPAARQFLIANDLPAKDVEEMPHYQVATLYTLAIYHEHLDDLVKYNYLPYHDSNCRNGCCH